MIKFLNLVLFGFLAFTLSCQSSKKPLAENPPEPVTGTWVDSMHVLQNGLTRLLPLAADPQKFYSATNEKQISQELSEMLKASKAMKKENQSIHKDLSIQFLSTGFYDDLETVSESFVSGKRDFARYTLLNISSYCIECHTRTSSGPQFRSNALDESLKDLKTFEKGEYYLSMRQFDAALKEFEKTISNALADQGRIFELDKALRHSLAITVRFMESPRKTLEVFRWVDKSQNVPYYLRNDLKEWRKSVREWTKEKRKNLKSAAEILQVCRDLVRKGELEQENVDERSGDIYFLRAQSALYPLLEKQLSKDEMGEAYYLMGLTYEALKDTASWDLSEAYLKSCIEKVPGSAWAKKCYEKYEESVQLGYSGSGGTNIPPEVQSKMNELKAKALGSKSED